MLQNVLQITKITSNTSIPRKTGFNLLYTLRWSFSVSFYAHLYLDRIHNLWPDMNSFLLRYCLKLTTSHASHVLCLTVFCFTFQFCIMYALFSPFCYVFFFFLLILQQDPKKAENFDKMFTRSAFKLTPTDALVVMNIDESAFHNFSYTNPYYRPQPSSLSQSPSTHHL